MTNWYRPIGDDGPPTKIKPNHDSLPIDKDVLIEGLIETVEDLAKQRKHVCCEIVEEAYSQDLPGFRKVYEQRTLKALTRELERLLRG